VLHTLACIIFVMNMLASAAAGAQHDTNHNDALVPGQAGETRIAREVRHQLVMLPYYGAFDDIAFFRHWERSHVGRPCYTADTEVRRQKRDQAR